MPARLRRARLATFVFFGLNGFVLAMWVVHIPIVEHRTGISHSGLGALLLLLGLGALAGMRLCGPLADRHGPRIVMVCAVPLLGLALAGSALATDAVSLAVAVVPFGFANGAIDVSMNAHAVAVQRRYQRPIMAAFHAAFSIGNLAGSLVGARTISWGWELASTQAGVGVFAVLLCAVAGFGLLGRSSTDAAATTGGTGPRPRALRRELRRLGLLALLLMLAEGVASDWAAVHLRDVRGAPAATAALGYAAFATAMTAGRLVVDRVAVRVGPVAVLSAGAALSAVALATAALSPWVPLAVAGWAGYGIGLSGCVPQIFTIAGNANPATAGANLSLVAGTGYFGLLAGPAAIGALARFVPLSLALLLPIGCCALAVVLAGGIRQAGRPIAGADSTISTTPSTTA